VEARNLLWHALLGELRVAAIYLSNMAIAGPLRSIFSIALDELAHKVELPIGSIGIERFRLLFKLRICVLRRLWESTRLGKLGG
jgi:hypothetical protein